MTEQPAQRIERLVAALKDDHVSAAWNAARELAALGYTNVRDYAGGKQDWIDAGLPTESEHQH